MTTAATIRALVQRDLKDESAVRWTADEIDRAVAKALDEYSLANPVVTSKDVAKSAGSDTLNVSAETGYIYALWVEYPIGDTPPTAVRFREERKGYVRIVESTQPVDGQNVRVWYAKGRAADYSDLEVEHEDVLVLGGVAYALQAAASGAIGAVNVSGWTPRQYKELATERLEDYRKRLRAIEREWSPGSGPAVVWDSSDV